MGIIMGAHSAWRVVLRSSAATGGPYSLGAALVARTSSAGTTSGTVSVVVHDLVMFTSAQLQQTAVFACTRTITTDSSASDNESLEALLPLCAQLRPLSAAVVDSDSDAVSMAEGVREIGVSTPLCSRHAQPGLISDEATLCLQRCRSALVQVTPSRVYLLAADCLQRCLDLDLHTQQQETRRTTSGSTAAGADVNVEDLVEYSCNVSSLVRQSKAPVEKITTSHACASTRFSTATPTLQPGSESGVPVFLVEHAAVLAAQDMVLLGSGELLVLAKVRAERSMQQGAAAQQAQGAVRASSRGAVGSLSLVVLQLLQFDEAISALSTTRPKRRGSTAAATTLRE